MAGFFSMIKAGMDKAKSVNNEIDLTLPKALWGIEEFRGEQTSLSDLYSKKTDIARIENKIELENRILNEKLKEIKTNYTRDLDIITTDLVKERDTKRRYFESKLNRIENERSETIRNAKQECIDEKNRRILEKESSYKKELQRYHNLMDRCTVMFNTYGKGIKTGTTKKVSARKVEHISYQQLDLAITSIEARILDTLETSLVVDKSFKRVEGMNKAEVKKVGAITAITSLINPLVPILGAGIVVGTSVLGSSRAKKEIEKNLEILVYLYLICEVKYDEAYKDNKIDLSGLEELRDKTIEQAEIDYEESIKNLEIERDEWGEDYKTRCQRDYVTEFLERSDREMSRQSELTGNVILRYTEQLNRLKEEYQELAEELKIKNSIPNIVDLGSEEIFERLSKAKGLVDDFNMYSILDRLTFHTSEDAEDSIDPNIRAKIEYDNLLKTEEFQKLKTKLEPLIAEGKDRSYWENKRNEISREEDKYYLGTTDNLHLGKLNQPEKYGILSENQEVFSKGWDNKSILVFYNNNMEETILVNYLKYLTLQMVGKTGPDNIKVNIVNPTMDIKFNDILLTIEKLNEKGRNEKIADIIVNQSGETLNDFREHTRKYIKRLVDNDLSGGETFHSIIRKKRDQGSKCPGMILNILHRCKRDDDLIELNENSSTTGVVNICLIRNDILREEKMDNGAIRKYIEEDIRFYLEKTPIMMYINKNTDGKILNIVTNEGRYTQILLEEEYVNTNKVVNELRERYLRIAKNKTFTLIDEYINDIIPESEVWKGDATNGIQLNFGYVDGDKSKPFPIVLDEVDAPHGMLCGTTGGGKTVAIDTMINVLKMKYPPSQLDIFYYDFKRVGVATHAKPYKWPNASALSASVNGDYIISILKKLVEVQNERYAIADSLGKSNLSGIQKELRKRKAALIEAGEEEKAMSIEIPARLLLIIDEFQSAFDISDEVTAEVQFCLKELATKARAAGIHMLIVTQDPANTKVPDSVFNLFTTRLCTKATKSVSQSVLRNDFASRPENKFIGFLGANITNGTEEGNIQYVVPFSKPEMNLLYSKIASDKADEPNTPRADRSRDAVWFTDEDKVSFKNLEDYIDKYNESPYDIILGKKIEYQKEDIPYKFQLAKDTSQNISYISSSKEDKSEFYRTLMASINKDPNAEVLTMFAKEYDPAYKVEELTRKTTIKWTKFTEIETGRVLYQTYGTGISGADIESEKWKKELVDMAYMDDSFYTPMVMTRSEEREDESMNALYMQIMTAKINRAREARKNGTTTPRIYLILVEPERDPYIVPERLWASREVKQLINEGSSYGIHTIIITSKYYQMAEMDVFGWKIGKSVGEEASGEKIFKNLEEGVTKVNCMTNNTLTRKVMMPTQQERAKYAWE